MVIALNFSRRDRLPEGGSLVLEPLAQSDVTNGPAKSNEGWSFTAHAGLHEPRLAYLEDSCGLRGGQHFLRRPLLRR